MSIVEDLNEIKKIKKDINSAISEKSGDIQSDTPFCEYADKIRSIETSSSGQGLVVDAYTKAQSDAKFAKKEFEHSHGNKDILDNISVANSDTLMYLNKPVGVLASKTINKEYSGNNEDLVEVINVSEIYQSISANSIYNQEITVANISKSNDLTFEVKQKDLILLSVSISSNEIQSYQLNHSKDLIISIKGNYKIIYDLIAF